MIKIVTRIIFASLLMVDERLVALSIFFCILQRNETFAKVLRVSLYGNLNLHFF